MDDGSFVEQELGENCMTMDHLNAFHENALQDSFEQHENDIAAEEAAKYNSNKASAKYNQNNQLKGKDKVMDLFAQVDAMRADSDEDNSETDAEAVMNNKIGDG